jgi:hypothetical protein
MTGRQEFTTEGAEHNEELTLLCALCELCGEKGSNAK